MPDCNNCTETCPQAERAHETAKGRMYATQELVELVKKIENGQLVEVVRCKDCIHMENSAQFRHCRVWGAINGMGDEGFCNYGERKDNA